MSSIFTEYESLLESQLRPVGTGAIGEKGDTLKVEIPVFVLNSDNAEERWAFTTFCLRIAVSDDANRPLRQGALISLLCAHSQVMKNHVALASKQGEATIVVLEIDAIVDGVPVFNNRSGVTDERAQRFGMIARALPRACANGTPFTSPSMEDEPVEDITDALDRILSIQAQIWVTVAKSMTAFETADESEQRRLTKYIQQGRVQKRCMLYPVCRSMLQQIIRQSLAVRIFIVGELKRARNTAGGTSTYYNFVADIDSYIRNAGLTAFFLTLKYGVNTKTSVLALSSLAGDLQTVKQLMRLYKAKGEDAPYMTILGDGDQMRFAPAEYAQLYSFAMGMASVIDKGTSKYQFARDFLSPSFWRLGVEYAQSQGSNINEEMAAELRLSASARKTLTAAVSKAATGGAEYSMPQQTAGVMTGLRDEQARDGNARDTRDQQPNDSDEPAMLNFMRAVAQGMRDSPPQPPRTPGSDLAPAQDDNQDSADMWGL
ncbi:nucleoprotein [Avian paramyxovirus 17]|uniref:Nucleocapsid n=1 Tax=Avian paramyxovirus 17 TaxID=2094282 RepID=A0A2L2FP62_9MONO|nr:nucleoprotein [Avian paramyxovirus 17]AVG72384.1 nucleoprotein [Avian paramyxovirus 17]